MVFPEVASFCEDTDLEKKKYPVFLPQCVYAVYNLGHIFTIIHVGCFRVEDLEEEEKNEYSKRASQVNQTLSRTPLRWMFTVYSVFNL